ncbi:SMP-30/gluconolactonase/LRE family protein [Methylobacter marinus]|uniref:hypothetical protein n=1 Tax=Methylobacter marinus TaxID=34058 RepID=UPI0003794020|nr:hypothetical protein [Methylobacter marinus]
MFNLLCSARILLIASLFSQTISTGFGAEASGCKPGSGYVLYANDHSQSDDSSNLYVLNLYLRNTELAYPLNLGETGIREMTDIAFLPDGKLFGVTFTRLVAIDTVTRQGEFVGDIIGEAYLSEERWINALAASVDGQLYAATRDGELLTIDTETGQGNKVGVYGNDLGSSGDLVFLPNGTLYGTARQLNTLEEATDLLIRIDPHSGQAEIIGDIGFKQVFSLAVGPRDELLGVADGNGRPLLIKINKHNGKGRLIAPLPDTDGMWGMIARDLCADHR